MPNLSTLKLTVLKITTFQRVYKLRAPIITKSNNLCLADIGQNTLFAETHVHLTKQTMQDVSFIYYY